MKFRKEDEEISLIPLAETVKKKMFVEVRLEKILRHGNLFKRCTEK